MHLHQYLTKDGVNLFNGEDGLTEFALCYVGGLLKHGRSLMAWTNPSTNSYRRLVPGYEAPVNLVFGSANRTAAVRVPSYARGDKRRIELRTMDATCNPYLAFAAILMAGIDGIQQGFHAAKMGLFPSSPICTKRSPGKPRRAVCPKRSTAWLRITMICFRVTCSLKTKANTGCASNTQNQMRWHNDPIRTSSCCTMTCRIRRGPT